MLGLGLEDGARLAYFSLGLGMGRRTDHVPTGGTGEVRLGNRARTLE